MANNEFQRMQQLAGIKEITVNKPTGGKFSSNKALYDFLNKNIKAFAEHELHDTTVGYYVLGEFYNQIKDSNEFTEDELGEIENAHSINEDELSQDLLLKIKDRLINILTNAGLDYYGEYPDNEVNGTSWNLEIGKAYSNTDEPDPESYEWMDETFKGRNFYSISFDI